MKKIASFRKSRIYLLLGIILIAFISIPAYFFFSRSSPGGYAPCDVMATENTVNLFHNLHNYADDGVLFGHQDTFFYGLNGSDLNTWSEYQNFNRSDVLSLTGSFPAVFGFDSFGDPSYFRNAAISAFNRGGIVTVSWHANNFETGGSFYGSTDHAIDAILPDGDHHANLTLQLDKIAETLGNLEVNGESIPIIFRPWHENNGDWFWWGYPQNPKDDFKALFRFTVEYLRDTKGVHNFLYAYSPNQPAIAFTEIKYLSWYPGDDVVDIMALDAYHNPAIYPGDSWKSSVQTSLRRIVDLAASRGKLVAFSETGLSDGLSEHEFPTWYTDVLLDLLSDPKCRQVSYVMVWRNANYGHFWVPYEGHQNEADFMTFYQDPYTTFLDELPNMYISIGN